MKNVKKKNNDEWRDHILSEEHLERAGKRYFEYCKMTYYTSIKSNGSQFLYESGNQHTDSDVYIQNKERSSYR